MRTSGRPLVKFDSFSGLDEKKFIGQKEVRNLQKISMNKDKDAGNNKVCLVNIELTGSSLAYLIFVQIRKRHSSEQTQPQICSARPEYRLHFSSLTHMLLCNTQTVQPFATALGE